MDRTKIYLACPIDRSKREIRLLELDPVCPQLSSGSDAVHCTLVSHSLKTSEPASPAVPFTALSYTWGGNPAFTKHLHIGDNDILISENLHTALSAFRRNAGDADHPKYRPPLCEEPYEGHA